MGIQPSDPNASAAQNYKNQYIDPLNNAWQAFQKQQDTETLGALKSALFNADAGMCGEGGLLDVLNGDENSGNFTANDLPDTIAKCGSLVYHLFGAIRDIMDTVHKPASAALTTDLENQMNYIFKQFSNQSSTFTILDNAPTNAQTVAANLTDPAIGNGTTGNTALDVANAFGNFLNSPATASGGPFVFASLQNMIQAINSNNPTQYQTALTNLQTALGNALATLKNTTRPGLITQGGMNINGGQSLMQAGSLYASIADAKAIVDNAISTNSTINMAQLEQSLGTDATGQPVTGIAGSVWEHQKELVDSLNIMPTG